MQPLFRTFRLGKCVLFLGVSTALMVESGSLPNYPFDAIHLVFEITFVLFLLTGLVILYERWLGQHEDPRYGA